MSQAPEVHQASLDSLDWGATPGQQESEARGGFGDKLLVTLLDFLIVNDVIILYVVNLYQSICHDKHHVMLCDLYKICINVLTFLNITQLEINTVILFVLILGPPW